MVEDRKEGERCQRWESLQDGIYELTLSSLINISAHLSKFLVDESKFESVVHFVFVIGHYQLGPLHIHKNSHFPLSPPRSLILLNLLHTFSLLWLLGKHVFPLYRHVSRVGLLGPRYVRLTCNKPPRSSARAAILSLPLADRDTDGFFFFFFFSFPEAQTESMLHHTPPQGAKEERQIHPMHFRKLLPSLNIVDHFQSDVLTEQGRC